MKTVVVVGGGPAGMLAALTACKNARVIILEKNAKLGKKLYITGKGRCNFTNDTSPSEFLANVVTNPKFLSGALYTFTPAMAANLLTELGCPVKTERGGRMFPDSDKSGDVLNALQEGLIAGGVEIRLNTTVKNIIIDNGAVCGVITDCGEVIANSVILATGGLSYPATGSTGDGYAFACKCGIDVIPPAPSLAPLICSSVRDANGVEISIKNLPFPQGLSLKNVTATAAAGKIIKSEFGEMLFTENGLSGPIILTLSAYVNRMKCGEYTVTVDLKPALDANTLDLRILRDFDGLKNKDFKNSLGELLPSSLIPLILVLSRISPEKKVNSITREERAGLVRLLKGLTFCGLRIGSYDDAIVTAGGISVKEVSPKTMESLKIKGLYFAGEVLDVDGLTGGYNIQIAFSTGYLAGKAATN